VVKINSDLQHAMEYLKKAEIKALKCPYRPKYHFLPIANWMNDPNGPIFYNGEYHLFYQYYPFKDDLKFDQFWEMSWGHAKSSDLVHWERLPIALMPSHEKGEDGCWSGTCILNNGIPTIIYSSVSKLKSPHDYAEQWLATSKDGMITWDKYVNNPILTMKENSQFEIHDWRDPFIWRESNKWFMIIGGHEHSSSTNSHGVVLLYESVDLFDWKFKGLLSKGNRKLGRGWECPNFFSLENKHILIVSPFKEVIYSIGTYKSGSFLPNDWRLFDHGKCFYATNTMLDDKKRRILWGWIKGGGKGGWNGCLSLPRILTLGKDENLIIKPPKELEKLRESHFEFGDLLITENSELFLGNFLDLTLEIIAKFRLNGNEKFGIKLFLNDIPGENIEFDAANSKVKVGKEIGKLEYQTFPRDVLLHIFIDKSVIEMYVNYRYCITSRVFPKTESSNGFSLFSKNASLGLKKLDIWSLKSIW
jgi:beta-fructofuranosidase